MVLHRLHMPRAALRAAAAAAIVATSHAAFIPPIPSAVASVTRFLVCTAGFDGKPEAAVAAGMVLSSKHGGV